MVRRIVDQGHELASHGYGHQRASDLSEAEFFASAQQQYLAAREGKQQQGESPALLEKLAKIERATEELRKDQEERNKVAAEQHLEQRRTQLKGQQIQSLQEIYQQHRDEFPHLHGYSDEGIKETFAEEIDFLLANGIQTSAVEVLSILDEREKRVSSRRRSTNNPGGAQAAQAGNTPVGALSGQALPAATQKAPAATRTVPTNHDAANSGGARREPSERETLLEVDEILRKAQPIF